MFVTRCLCVFTAVLLTCAQSPAKDGGVHSEDPYNPQHIDILPPEIRSAIFQRCSTPKALHHFAGYFDNSKRIVLHFEDFHCDQRDTFCNSSGCLHQVWVSSGGHYTLVRSYYAPAGD
jgi:hypothetical protein